MTVLDVRPGPGTVARALRAPVLAYRRWVSPALPPRCRFHPSCSAYAVQALDFHGAVRGSGLAAWRVLRCHPFHPGGYDPVPGPVPAAGERDTTAGPMTRGDRWTST